jgi:hypothetical protein
MASPAMFALVVVYRYMFDESRKDRPHCPLKSRRTGATFVRLISEDVNRQSL